MTKINLGIVVLIVISALGCKTPTISKIVAAYPDGSTKTELILSPDEKIKYERISYFDDGKIALKGKFKDNKREGRWVSYFMDGKINSINNYKNGEYDGEYLVYNKDGNIILKGAYNNGLKFGVWTSFDKNGVETDFKKFDEKGNQIK